MNADLQKYILDNLARGQSRRDIELSLQAAGWKTEDIEANFPKQQMKVATHTDSSQHSFVSLLLANRASLILRIGLAFVFAYAAIFVSHPSTGGKYVPHFVTNFISLETFLFVFGIFEAILALLLLSGKLRLIAGLTAAGLLIGITVMNVTYFSTLFRNIAIIAAALTYAFL